MHQPNAGPIAAYNSLCDEHLSEYFASPRRINHLQKMGLITPDRRIMDEETVRARTVHSERKQREEDMIASAIVSEAVDLERKRRAEIKNKLDLLARYEQAEKVKSQKRQLAVTSEGLDFSPRLSPRLQFSALLGLRKDTPTPMVAHDMQNYLKKISLPNTLPVPRSNPYGLQTPHVTRSSYGPHSPYETQRSNATQSIYVVPNSQNPSYMTSGMYGPGSPNGSQYFSQSSSSTQGPSCPVGSFSSLNPSTVDVDYTMGVPSGEAVLVHLPHPPTTPPCTPVPQGPVVRARQSFVLPRSKTAPARLTRRQAKEGPTIEQSKIQSPVRSNVKITLRYLGRCGPVKRFCSNTVEVLQQHCGGNTVSLFKGGLKERDTFSIVSRRHLGMPFGLSLYVDGLIDCRVSTCCEYKHSPGRLIGPSKQAHFAVVGVEGGAPCSACEKDVRPKAGDASSAKQTDMAGTPVQVRVTDEETNCMAGEERGQRSGEDMLKNCGGQTESHSLTGRPPSNSHGAQLRDLSANHNVSSVSNSSTFSNVRDSSGHPSSPSVRRTAHPGGSATPVHPLTIRHEAANATHTTRSYRPPIQSCTPSHLPPPLPSLKLPPSHMPVPLHVPPLQMQPLQMLPPSSQPQLSEMSPPSSQPQPSEVPQSPPQPQPSEMQLPFPQSQMPAPFSQAQLLPQSPLVQSSQMPTPFPQEAPPSSQKPPLTSELQSLKSHIPQEAVAPSPLVPLTPMLTPESLPSQGVPLPLSQITLSQPLSSQVALTLVQNSSERETVSEVPQTEPVQVQLLSSEVPVSQIQPPLSQMPSPLLQHPLQLHALLEGDQLFASNPMSHSLLPKTSDVAAGPSEVFEESSKYKGCVNDSALETGEEDNNSTTVYEETEEERDTEVMEREDAGDRDNESERDSEIKDSIEGSVIEKEECEDSDKKEEDGEFEDETTSSHDEACEKEASIGTRETDETETEMEDNEMDLSTQGSGFIVEQASSQRPSSPLPPSSENEFETATGGRLERSDGGFEVETVKELNATLMDTSSAVFSRASQANGSSSSVEQAVSSASLHSSTAQSKVNNASRTSLKRNSKPDTRDGKYVSNADLSCLAGHDSPSHTQKTQHISSYSTSSFESHIEPASKQDEGLKISETHHQVPQPICSVEVLANTLQGGAKTKQPQSISSYSTRSLEKAVSVLDDEGETKDTLQEPRPKSASTLQGGRKSNDTPFCSEECELISSQSTRSVEKPASTLQVGAMVKDTIAPPQEHQLIASYSVSSFEKSSTTLHDGAKRNDMPPHSSKPQSASSYSASSFENQSESATALEEKGKTGEDEEDIGDKNGRSSRCSQRSSSLVAASAASRDSHSHHSSPPLDTVAVGGGEKHGDRIKNSPFVPSTTDQGSQSLLCQAMPSDQEIKSLRIVKSDKKIDIETAASTSLPMLKGSSN